jgi:hypothetical protein
MRSVVVLGFTAKTGNIAQVKSGGKVNVNYISRLYYRETREREHSLTQDTAAKVRCAKFGKLLRSILTLITMLYDDLGISISDNATMMADRR